MSNAGRKSKYQEYVQPYLKRVEHLCRMGATEQEICQKLGVSVARFGEYKKEFQELRESLKKGRSDADDTVEAALFRRATGYTTEEVKTNTYVDNNNNQRQFRVSVTKEIPPDTTAAIFWLKNRRPEKWRDRQELGIGGNIPVKLIEEEKNL